MCSRSWNGARMRFDLNRLAADVHRTPGSCSRLAAGVQRIEEHTRHVGYVVHRLVECSFVGLRRLLEPADLAHELECRVVQLLVTGAVIRMPEPFDVPTHWGATSLTFLKQ